jgi:hypothetical protein
LNYNKQKKPNGERSNIYIIINNDFFKGESDEIYQIHFESEQIRNRSDSAIDIIDAVINKSDGIGNFFYEELVGMAKEYKRGIERNIYVDFLLRFGFSDSLFEFYDDDTSIIRLMTRKIKSLPDISKFTELDQLIITDANMLELHPSIGGLSNLRVVSFSDNKLTSLPSEIGNLSNMIFISLAGNPISHIPETIKYLDKQNGGRLERISVYKEDVGEENYKKLKRLLPSVEFSE